MAVDRKFEIVNPSSLDKLTRKTIEVGSLGLITPNGVAPVPLVDGELVQWVNGKLVRATDPLKPSFFSLEDRGDLGVQVARKLSIVIGGGNFVANTVLFDPALTVEMTAVKLGTVTIEGVARAALVAHGGTGLILGYVLKPATVNSGKLQVLVTFN